MSIFVSDNFEVRKAAPIDTRDQTQNLASLILLPVSYNYQDMLVWVISEEQFYRLASGDGSVSGNWVLATKFLIDETNPTLGANLDAAGFDILNAGIIQGHRESIATNGNLTIDSTYIDQMLTHTLAANEAITVDDTSITNLPKDAEFEIVQVAGAFTLSFVAGGAQTIISKESNLNLDGIGAAAILKYIGSNTWLLIGDLIA